MIGYQAQAATNWNNSNIKKVIQTQVEEFEPRLGVPKALTLKSIKAARKQNAKYCDIGVWSMYFPPEDRGVIKGFASTEGNSLFKHRSNTDEFGSFIYRNVLKGIIENNLEKLKSDFLFAVNKKAFTSLKASTFTDAFPNYPMFGEPKMRAHSALLTMAVSYAVLESQLSDNEKEAAKNWGRIFFANMKTYEDGTSSLTAILNGAGPDRNSIKIMAMSAWSMVTEDKTLFKKSLSWYLAALEQIQDGGFHKHFIKNHRSKEIKYHNDTYGALSIAAFFFEEAGFPALSYKNSTGNSLADGLDMLFNYLGGKNIGRKLPEPQKLEDVNYHSRGNYGTIAYAEYLKLMVPDGLSPEFNKVLNQMRNTGRLEKSMSRNGLYSVIHGGYTTCLLAMDMRPNANTNSAISNQSESALSQLLDFYNHADFDQRSCLIRTIGSTDLWVMFKSNAKLPSKRLEERRQEAYEKCSAN